MGIVAAEVVGPLVSGAWPTPVASSIVRVGANMPGHGRGPTRDDYLAVYLRFDGQRGLVVAQAMVAQRLSVDGGSDPGGLGSSDWFGRHDDTAPSARSLSPAPWTPLISYRSSPFADSSAGRYVDARI